MKLLQPLFALATSATLLTGLSVPAQAQYVNSNPRAASSFLNSLYDYLREENALAYHLATTGFNDQDNLDNAGAMCHAFSLGATVDDILDVFIQNLMASELSDTQRNAVGIYLGAVLANSGAHYCPEYWPLIQDYISR